MLIVSNIEAKYSKESRFKTMLNVSKQQVKKQKQKKEKKTLFLVHHLQYKGTSSE